MASKPKSATPANGNTASDVKRNTIDPDVIKQDVLSALHSMLENDTSNVKLNQRIAWDIMRWRDQLVANDVKPADFANMIGSPSATAAWKKQVASSKWKDFPGYGLAESGYIDLQDHGHEIWFRNIFIKVL